MQGVSFVIPAYNEEHRIAPTLHKCLEQFAKYENFEIIVVDDGSTDNTAFVVKQYSESNKKILLIQLGQNFGKGRAIQEGILNSKFDRVLYLDSDGSADLSKVDYILSELDKGYDCVIGSRYLAESDAEISFHRKVCSRVFNLFVRLVFGLNFTDTQCGFKGFRSESVKPIIKNLKIFRFAFDVELIWRLDKAGAKIREIPIRWVERGGTKVNLIKHGCSMVKDLILLRFGLK
ncbi:MAG: glycosyltransferase family 2 protein [Deltaproteobacteria bacterium]|nr:glycosyltransferase family 2 protein [Deltaproteobacteria bacterium]